MSSIRTVCSIAIVITIAACNSNTPPAPPAAAAAATSSEIVGIAPKNAIVTLLPAAGPPPMPDQPAVMDQQSKQFIPNVLLVRPGQPVEFRNSEETG